MFQPKFIAYRFWWFPIFGIFRFFQISRDKDGCTPNVRVLPWYLLCSTLGFLGIIIHKYPLYRDFPWGFVGRGTSNYPLIDETNIPRISVSPTKVSPNRSDLKIDKPNYPHQNTIVQPLTGLIVHPDWCLRASQEWGHGFHFGACVEQYDRVMTPGSYDNGII